MKSNNLLYTIIIFSTIQFNSCSDIKNDNQKNQHLITNNQDAELKKKVILNGDIDAYEQLLQNYMHDSHQTDLLAYAIVMANEHNYIRANYDVFEMLYSTVYYKEELDNYGSCVDYSLECLDDKTKKLALEYLKKAIEKGDLTASETLLNFYNKDKHYPIEELYTDTALVEKAKANIK